MTTRRAQVSRGLAAAALSTCVAALAHSVANGHAPSGVAVALSLAFSSLLCIAIAGRRFSWQTTTLSVLLSQLLFHGIFTLEPSSSQGTAAASLTPPHSATPIHQIVPGGPSAPPVLHGDMVLTHLAAAVITIFYLIWVQGTMTALGRTLRLRLGALLSLLGSPLDAPHLPSNSATPGETRPRGDRRMATTISYRGPPAIPAISSIL